MLKRGSDAMQTDFNIAICGAGPVGMALAVMLARRSAVPARIALIDAKTPEQAMLDPRSIALSWGSRQLLEQLGAWPSSAATAIEQIHVSRRGHFGRTLIDCTEYQLPALGYVLRYGAIASALQAQIDTSGVTVIRPATVLGISEIGDAASIAFQGEQPTVTAGIVVQAEGGLFGEQEQKALHRDYDQSAVVAHVRTDAPVAHRAFERFCDEGPLALLPQDDGYALVWCVRPDTARHLLALDDQKFLRELGEAFGGRLGHFTAVTKRNAFSLGLNAGVVDSAHRVAIGNAAQTLHPVAGQGLNLGLRDANMLARLLTSDIDMSDVLTRFAASRKQDRNLTIHLTDAMARLFARTPAGTLPQTLLGFSLGLVDGIAPARRLLAEQMMFGRRA